MCKECSNSEVEDVVHWLLRCPAWSSHWQTLLAFLMGDNEKIEYHLFIIWHKDSTS